MACGGCHTMVQAVLEVDDSKSKPLAAANGDISLRLHKIEGNQDEKSPVGINEVIFIYEYILM